ncbi:hypothetical protein F2Q68_00043036 [Brassica cretica]|uniref:Uncharacterized protein n=1 Tax=Brassica cretica TaxID=69181 RepID=A0A8S9LCD6_BRACR|nr:hypothetical protein F2Q68_00043036 [Brassica cretica]
MHKEFVEKFQHHRGQKNDVLVTVKETKYLGQNMLYMPTPKLEHESVQVKAKVSHIFDNLVYDLSPTGMSHLSLSKNVKTCLEVQQKPASTSLLESKVLKELCPRSKEIFVPKEEETSSQGDTSDKQSVQGVYLNNKKEFVYETNFTRSRTHKGVIEALNFKRSFTDQKVMNFTSQRFLSPSICEYPTLEGDSGPRKERPDTLEIGPCYCQVNSGNCNI